MYYGPNAVLSKVGDENYVILELDNQKKVVVPTSQIDVLITDKPTDLTELRRLRTLPVIQSTLILMKKFNLRQDEVEYVLGMVAESVNQSMTAASDKLWGIDNYGEQTFLQIDDVLTK